MAPIVPILAAVASVGGIVSAVSSISAAKDAKRDAAKQAALVKKQEEKIALEKEKQDRSEQERRARLSSTELLSGTEQGITGDTTGQLLGGS